MIMKNTNPQPQRLTKKQLEQWHKDRDAIERELPQLAAKHERIRQAAQERTVSGALRRSIHSSKILLHDLARRADTDLKSLDNFLTGEQPLTSDVIDRLVKVLRLKLEPALANSRPRRPRKAG
jgi:hypothetical protein